MTKTDTKRGRRKPRSTPSTPAPPPYVKVVAKADGRTYLYYQRDGQRVGLPGPLGSAAFHAAYDGVHRGFEGSRLAAAERVAHTVDRAVAAYLGSADFRELKPGSQGDYRRVLDRFRGHFGHLLLARVTEPWLLALRDKHAPDPALGDAVGRANDWNALRSRMIAVVDAYRRRHPEAVAGNPWREVRRLKAPEARSHRPWPRGVLLKVMAGATPEFRALLAGYLLTAQRGGDVTAFRPEQYDPAARTLNLSQEKTAEPMLIHVPETLARAIEGMRGRRADCLFATPRGRRWTTANAQETLQTLLTNLGLPRHTLHGLRATGPVALKMLGFENRAIRALTGHASDAALEVYLRGVDHYPLAREAQEALEGKFGPVFDEASDTGGRSNAAGATGREAAKLGVVGRARARRRQAGG